MKAKHHRMTKLFKDRKGTDLVPYVSSRDDRHEVVAPVSSVRIGETSKSLVRSKDCVDYPRWVTIFVGKSEKECKLWLDRYKNAVISICRPYEVSS
jgi:hypothetical protein